MTQHRGGVALIGSTIVDELIPVLEPGQLTYVDANRFVPESELKGEDLRFSTGGMAMNVAVNLAKMKGGYPVAVYGKVGNDHRADLIRETLSEHEISTETLIIDHQNETSWTHVLHIRMPDGKIERVFRHALGAMGGFDAGDINPDQIAKFNIAMVGYGLLMPKFDLEDKKFGTVMGSLLSEIQKRGVKTAIDFVSPDEDNLWKFNRYRSTMNFVDICCINEDQACSLTGLKDPRQACKVIVDDLGAKVAVVHCGAEGPNYAYSQKTGTSEQANFIVSADQYQGNAGAGDAFSAGFLHGFHQAWPMQDCLRFASAAAAISLGDVSCTGAMREEKYIMNYMKKTPVMPL